jgi:hypothetical protein
MAAFARQHLLPFGHYTLHYFSRSFPRENGEWLTRKTEELDHERLLVTVILVLSQTVIGYLYIWRLWLGTLVVQSYGHRSLYLY